MNETLQETAIGHERQSARTSPSCTIDDNRAKEMVRR